MRDRLAGPTPAMLQQDRDPAARFWEEMAALVDPAAAIAAPGTDQRIRLTNARELQQWIEAYLGVRVPGTRVCKDHQSPLDALAAAYFAIEPRIVWLAARGFGGKTVLLAVLSMTEAITLGAGVTLLGGSLEQSQRVLAYMQGEDNLEGKFWAWPQAPRHLLRSDPTARHTRLANGGWITALTASTKSVRGPHPQRVRGDEIDEMTQDIWNAAQGQAKANAERGIADQVVGSSTHHYPNGTMTEELKEAAERKRPVFRWCWRETSADGGFVSAEEIARKKASVTVRMWEVEYDLGEPSVEGRAILTEAVEKMFDPTRGEVDGAEQLEPYIFEKPVWELDPDWRKATTDKERRAARRHMRARYAAGADWGKTRDHTNAWVFRIDTDPWRVVAFLHQGRRPYPVMFKSWNDLVKRFDAVAAHDATGLGTVAEDYMDDLMLDVSLNGARRSTCFSDWIVKVENGGIVGPRIKTAYHAHRYVTVDDLFGGGHPPDEFVSAALAAWAAEHGREAIY